MPSGKGKNNTNGGAKGKGNGRNASGGKGGKAAKGGGARQTKRFEFADASKFADAATVLLNDIVSDTNNARGPNNLRYTRAMHNAWQKHLDARKLVVAERVSSYDGCNSDYDGNTGVTPLQSAEDALYNSNKEKYDLSVNIFNEKYKDLQGKYTEEAPSKNALGDQVETLREIVTTMQTDNANFRQQVLEMLSALVEADPDQTGGPTDGQRRYKKRRRDE